MPKKNYHREILKLQQELEKQLSWGPASEWHSSMFTELSEKIFDNIHVNISPATLKRFFGVVTHDGAPSTSTLDYLSQYLGYENWRAFRLSSPVKAKHVTTGVSNKAVYVSLGFVLAIITIMVIANKSPEIIEIPGDITFTSRILSSTYPNSVVFDFDLKGVTSDSIYIQQYWDPTKTISIDEEQSQATGIYYFPGYFRAKLLIEGKIIREHDLFLKSRGWIGTVEYEPVPKYFIPESSHDADLGNPEVIRTEVSESINRLVTAYHYINDLGEVSGDNFKLSADVRNTFNDKWAVCQSLQVYVIGTTGAMIVPFSKVGCSSENNLMLNDIYLRGKEHDLSAFGVELDEYTSIQLVNEERDLSVFVKGQLIYTGKYNSSMGRLVGMRFKFLGTGEVKDVKLLDQFDTPVDLR